MEKKRKFHGFSGPWSKVFLLMRLSIFLFFAFIITVQAKSFSQTSKLTLDISNAKLIDVLNEIEEQTEYYFYFNMELDNYRVTRVDAKDQNIDKVLDLILNDLGLEYEIVDRYIVIKRSNSDGSESNNLNALQQKAISGLVTDGTGAPLPGVTVVVKGTATGTITDFDGKYTLKNVPEEAVLVFSFVGMKTQELSVSGKSSLDVVMAEDAIGIEEVVAVGYGVQKKATLTGSVAAVKGDEIVATKNENAQNMLTGKISGVRVTQRTAEPGAFHNNFDIRAMGSPLIIIDGIPRSEQDFQRLDPNDIDNMSVLKDASAAIYGVRAANGVVLVTTKRGANNKLEMNYSGSFTWQIPSGLPATVNVPDYMTLRNERSMHNVNGGAPIYTQEQMDEYLNGTRQGTDWYDLVFSDYAPQTMHNLNATGGNERTTFYVGLGYQYQEGFFKSSDLTYNKYNIRSNISTKITDNLTLDVNLNLIMDEQDRPNVDSWWIIRGFWRQGAHIPAYANNDPTKPYHGLIEGDNPISFMNKDLVGFKTYNKKWVQPAASLKYDIPGVKGLYVKGLFSYDYYVSSDNLFKKEYTQYRYDEASDTYETFTRQSPNTIKRESYFRTQMLSQTSINYNGTFDKHDVGAIAIWETQKRTSDNFSAQRNLVLPLPYLFAGEAEGQLATMNSGENALYEDSNLALAGRLNYAYDDKYLAEFLFRYDGSSRFGTGHQWGFFPAASLGWRISEEGFFENSSTLAFVDQLKLRASYGKTGDDNAARYQFISGYNYPTSSDRRNFTGGYVFDGSFNASADNKGIPNELITWYTSNTFDVGVDFVGWNGLLGVTVDYFSRNREGLLATRDGGIPTVVGASLPDENLNSDRTYGYDLEVSHRNQIRNFSYNVKGILSLARVKRLYVERGDIGSSWSNWKNNQNDRLQGVHMGYNGAGRFESWEDIWSSPVYIGRGTIVGDYAYEDWNGDGEINGNDAHPIRYNQYPWMNFSFIFDASYKDFDLNFLLQGSAMSSTKYGEQLREPLWGNGNSSAMQQFMDRWHPVDPNADPYDPATEWVPGRFAYTGTLPDYNSSFNAENGAYLRLKSVELGYTLPSELMSKTGIKNLRLYVNAYNLFTLTKVDYMDPEHNDETYGYLYPLNKTVSVGLNVKF
ncbi:TonB-dependent receptor [Sunxiuqinia sp. A32]|uniref:TonB-dependent receptor n=1 Tax=Sunxiuqinia sp. A32 TaxID=3461496 RepID=UPI004046698E